MSIAKDYTKEIKRQLNYSAVWLPTTTVSVGDIGEINDYQFKHVTTLKDQGIPFETIPESVSSSIDYYSRNSVAIRFKGAGEAPLVGSSITKADAGVNVKFSKDGAIVFKAIECTAFRIKNLVDLGEVVKTKYKNKDWNPKWVVVRECITAKKGTILISRGSNSEIDVKAGADVGPQGLSLANLGLNFQVSLKKKLDSRLWFQQD